MFLSMKLKIKQPFIRKPSCSESYRSIEQSYFYMRHIVHFASIFNARKRKWRHVESGIFNAIIQYQFSEYGHPINMAYFNVSYINCSVQKTKKKTGSYKSLPPFCAYLFDKPNINDYLCIIEVIIISFM